MSSLTVPRTGKNPESFCRSCGPEEAVRMLAPKGHRWLEFLATGGQGKLYLDRDVYVGVTPPTADTIAMHASLVRDHVQEMLDRLRIGGYALSVVIATRHGFCSRRSRYKLSFRPFVQGMRIRRVDIPRVITWVGQQDFWDMSVYKQNEQLLAAINGCKGQGDARILLPAHQDTDVLSYVAQHTDPSWPLLDLPGPSAPERGPIPDSGLRGGAQPDFIRDMLACLSTDTADDRRTWIKIGMVLKREGQGYYSDWLCFSRRGTKFRGDRDCLRTWASLPTAGACTLGTLCFHARRNDVEAYGLAMVRHGQRK